ncbi:MAG: hypothetical protein F6K39_02160 [Okeania sp. SIO3B3]|nr:hypothetical protein [Okeania sp. SIO3B3]
MFTIPQYTAATPMELALARLDDTRRMLALGRKNYTGLLLRVGDWFSHRWLGKADFPYADELRKLAGSVDEAGVLFLNLSYEWGCTTGVAHDEKGNPVLLRTLDWPLKGLGEQLVCARFSGPAGDYLSLTYPGFLGAHTVLAPGRFAAALNQAPLPHRGATMVGDWFLSRLATGRSCHCPATFLLRQAAETCPDFDSLVELLSSAPLCIPAIFIVSGTQPGQGVVVEREYERAQVYGYTNEGEMPVATNHWHSAPWPGRDRPTASRERAQAMRTLFSAQGAQAVGNGFAWLTPPIMNRETRIAAEMDVAAGSLRAVAVEGNTILSHELRISA